MSKFSMEIGIVQEVESFISKDGYDGLRVRAEGNTDSEIIYQLADGEEIAILDNTQDDEWIKVDVDGDEG